MRRSRSLIRSPRRRADRPASSISPVGLGLVGGLAEPTSVVGDRANAAAEVGDQAAQLPRWVTPAAGGARWDLALGGAGGRAAPETTIGTPYRDALPGARQGRSISGPRAGPGSGAPSPSPPLHQPRVGVDSTSIRHRRARARTGRGGEGRDVTPPRQTRSAGSPRSGGAPSLFGSATSRHPPTGGRPVALVGPHPRSAPAEPRSLAHPADSLGRCCVYDLRRARPASASGGGVELQIERDALVHRLDRLDATCSPSPTSARPIVDALADLRELLYPPVPWARGRRPPDVDHSPLPAATEGSQTISGRDLRTACVAILRRHGPLPCRSSTARSTDTATSSAPPGPSPRCRTRWPTRSSASAPDGSSGASTRPPSRRRPDRHRARAWATAGWPSPAPAPSSARPRPRRGPRLLGVRPDGRGCRARRAACEIDRHHASSCGTYSQISGRLRKCSAKSRPKPTTKRSGISIPTWSNGTSSAAPGRLGEQRATTWTDRGWRAPSKADHVREGEPGVDDVLDDVNVLAGNVDREVLDQRDRTRRLGGRAVRRDLNEVDTTEVVRRASAR